MFRLLKIVAAIALILGLAYGASYAGSRAAVGKIVGPNPTFMGQRRIQFQFKGVEELEGKPRAWVYTYHPTELPGVAEAKIYVTWDGKLIRTLPRNLADRIQIHRDREP